MRTTLDLDEDVMLAAKELAARSQAQVAELKGRASAGR
jgi:hypothetical protein